jgi:hypothetical protein
VVFNWRWEGEGRWRSAGKEMKMGKKFEKYLKKKNKKKKIDVYIKM